MRHSEKAEFVNFSRVTEEGVVGSPRSTQPHPTRLLPIGRVPFTRVASVTFAVGWRLHSVLAVQCAKRNCLVRFAEYATQKMNHTQNFAHRSSAAVETKNKKKRFLCKVLQNLNSVQILSAKCLLRNWMLVRIFESREIILCGFCRICRNEKISMTRSPRV